MLAQPVPEHPVDQTALGGFVLKGDDSHRLRVKPGQGTVQIQLEKAETYQNRNNTEQNNKIIGGIEPPWLFDRPGERRGDGIRQDGCGNISRT
jgi:hypothetical protein